MSVDSNGKESFFATVEKSQALEKKRIEKKAAEKKELKAKEKKKAEKKAQEERIHDKVVETHGKEYVTIEADSMDDLLSKVQSYSYSNAARGRERDTGGSDGSSG